MQSPTGSEVTTIYKQGNENSLCTQNGACLTGTDGTSATGRLTSVRWEQR